MEFKLFTVVNFFSIHFFNYIYIYLFHFSFSAILFIFSYNFTIFKVFNLLLYSDFSLMIITLPGTQFWFHFDIQYFCTCIVSSEHTHTHTHSHADWNLHKSLGLCVLAPKCSWELVQSQTCSRLINPVRILCASIHTPAWPHWHIFSLRNPSHPHWA